MFILLNNVQLYCTYSRRLVNQCFERELSVESLLGGLAF